MKAFALADEASGGSFLEIPAPEPGAGEVRVRIRASSVNGWDVFVASGMARGVMEHRYPAVTGKDYAGVVDTIGEGVTRFSVGDEVAGIAPPEQHVGRGSYAEYLVVPAEGFIEPKPDTLSFEQAASVGLAALTALVATDAVEVAKGETVLIAGATGGVGTYAVQLAAGQGGNMGSNPVGTAVMCGDIKEMRRLDTMRDVRRLSRADRLAIRPRTVRHVSMTDTTCRACKISVVSIGRAS
jgi:NADPH:quinone reductase-like Zn-dependent oxidoreductase